MATQIGNKKLLLEWIEKEVKDDDIILLSQDYVGEISVNQKLNQKKIPFAFAADAFKRKDDIGHIAYGETPMVAFCVVKHEHASEETIETYNKIKP